MNCTVKIRPDFILTCFIFVAGIMLSSCTAKQIDPSLIINKPYYEARQFILQHGWMPVEGERSDLDGEYRLPHFYYDAGYAEVMACSGTGMGYCAFKFQNTTGQFLEVTTQGGDYDSGDLSRPIVIRADISD